MARSTNLIHAFIIFALVGCASAQKTASEEKSFNSYLELATSYLEQGNTRNAANALEQASEIDDENPKLLQGYALLYQIGGDNEKAESFFLSAIEKDPDFSQVRNNYGVFLSRANRNPEALIELSKAASNPEYELRAVSYENMAEVALKVNNIKLAAQSMKNAALLSLPSKKRYFLRAAHLFYLDKSYSKAQEFFNRYLMITDAEGVDPTSDALQIGFSIAREKKDEPTQEYLKQRMKLLGPQVKNDKKENG